MRTNNEKGIDLAMHTIYNYMLLCEDLELPLSSISSVRLLPFIAKAMIDADFIVPMQFD